MNTAKHIMLTQKTTFFLQKTTSGVSIKQHLCKYCDKPFTHIQSRHRKKMVHHPLFFIRLEPSKYVEITRCIGAYYKQHRYPAFSYNRHFQTSFVRFLS